MKDKTIHVIGAGLAGCEAAWQISRRGIGVVLHEMKPQKYSPAHKNADFAELVCSNSLRSDDYLHNAVGLMHEEMRRAGSLVMECADQTKVPAGGALAVDRDGFAALITQRIKSHPLISVRHEEIGELPGEDFGRTIIATGPLTSDKLAHAILEKPTIRRCRFMTRLLRSFSRTASIFQKPGINPAMTRATGWTTSTARFRKKNITALSTNC